MLLKLVFSYDGSRFEGSATQPHKNSVQDSLNEALTHLGISEKCLFASRTDKGVHAFNAVASVCCGEHFKDLLYLKNYLNKFSKPHIYIKNIYKMPSNFQVRFDAKAREYLYFFNHKEFNPLLSSYFHFYPNFDLKKANEILQLFIGAHDFKFFQKESEAGKNSTRTMFKARAFKYKHLSIFQFRADGFLRAQIRLSISAILKVLENKLSIEELQEQIHANKEHSRTLVPPNALYLNKIFY